MMCKNCNCDFFTRCSIVGYMPIGYCCENCENDEDTTCLKFKAESEEKSERKTESIGEIKLISTSIEGELLKIIIEQKGDKEKTVLIDLKKYLES